LIEQVTFFNDDTGFGVLKVKAKGHRDLVTVVGTLASANAGEWVTAEGRWIQDREFGLQFKLEKRAISALSRHPTNRTMGLGVNTGPVRYSVLYRSHRELRED
jgi:exodeoxyribonuclease V alpha subunit